MKHNKVRELLYNFKRTQNDHKKKPNDLRELLKKHKKIITNPDGHAEQPQKTHDDKKGTKPTQINKMIAVSSMIKCIEILPVQLHPGAHIIMTLNEASAQDKVYLKEQNKAGCQV